MEQTKKSPYWGMFALGASLFLLHGCTASDTEADIGAVIQEELLHSDPMKVTICSEEPTTRGDYYTAAGIDEYAIYTFWSGRIVQQDVHYTKKEDGSWARNRNLTYPGTRAINLYALAPGFNHADEFTMANNVDEKSFVYTLPGDNTVQKDFMFSSLMDKTRENTNNSANFTFVHAFSYLRMVAKQTLANATVVVHSITLHNLKSKGKLTFGETEKSGLWEIYDSPIANYKFVLPEDITLTYNKNLSLHGTNNMLFVMPQKPELWNPNSEAPANTTTYADNAEHLQSYLELECRISTIPENEGESPRYIGCTETTWAHVYLPLAANTTWIANKKNNPFQGSGTYNLVITFNGGYTADGQDFLKANDATGLEMATDEKIESVVTTEPWGDDEGNYTESNKITM